MKYLRNSFFAIIAVAALGSGAWAQMMGRGMSGPPQIPGWFEPEVGSGSEYKVTTKEGPMVVQYAVVGKDSVDGQEGFWNEIRIKSGQGAGTVTKQLMVTGGSAPGIKRVIVQPPGGQPMEMPMGMMGGMMHQAPKSVPKNPSEAAAEMGAKVGTETVTVPAGTFLCDHYRTKNGSDIWISTKVYPYGLVKTTSKEMTVELQKTLTGQTSEIKGEPRKFEMPHF
jgi:hypothetical protein